MPRKPPTHPFALFLLVRLVGAPSALAAGVVTLYGAFVGLMKGTVPLPTGGKRALVDVALDTSPVAFVAGVTFWLSLGAVLVFGAWRLATARLPVQSPAEASGTAETTSDQSTGRMTPRRYFAYGVALLLLALGLRMLAAEGTILMVLYVLIFPSVVVGIVLVAWSAILLMVRSGQ